MSKKYQEALDRQKNNVKKLRAKEFVEYREDFATLQELVDLANVLEEYNVTPQNIRAVLMVGQMFIDKEINILEQLEKLKAAIKILRYEIGFDFLVDSNGVIAMEVLNGACLLKTEQYQLLKEVLNV